VNQFVESIHYRDFSRHFDVRRAPNELKPLRKGFNEINTTFKLISRERETQYHYLQKILELVDTGLMSYEQETGETGWINEAFKKPYRRAVFKNHPFTGKTGTRTIQQHHQTKARRCPGVQRNPQPAAGENAGIGKRIMRSDDKMYKLVAFQNVSEALDETESKGME
jgi:two-component system nitrogen regulation sensor histidine kinase NtrY